MMNSYISTLFSFSDRSGHELWTNVTVPLKCLGDDSSIRPKSRKSFDKGVWKVTNSDWSAWM